MESDVLRDMANTVENKANYDRYKEDVKRIISFGKYKADTGHLKIKRLNKAERKAFDENILRPIVEFGITVTIVKTNHRFEYKKSKSQRFYEATIKDLIMKLNEKSGAFYLYNEIWESLCRVEKGKLDKALMFAVFKKNNGRCIYCGTNKHLVVDYKKPISIGGKTALNNLRTTCKSCHKKREAQLKRLLARKVEGEYGYVPEEWK